MRFAERVASTPVTPSNGVMSEKPLLSLAARSLAPNRFDRMEWAGAFGDLGTLIPFVVAYIGMVSMDPFGILFAFGVAWSSAGSTIGRRCLCSR